MGLLGSALLLALCVGLAPDAAAEELSTFRLSWLRGDGAENCPGAQELERAVEARLGRDPFEESAEQAIEASVTRSGDAAWRVQIRVREAAGKAIGSRDLDTEATDCRAIADAIALAVALAIDPNAALGPAPPPLPRVVPPTPTKEGPAACPAPPACPTAAPCRCPPPPPPATRGTFTGRAILAGGMLPGVAFGAGVTARSPLKGPCPAGETTVTMTQPESGTLCLSGHVVPGENLAGMNLHFATRNQDGTRVFVPFDAATLGITQVGFAVDTPPPDGIHLSLSTVRQLECPGSPLDCSYGFTFGDLMEGPVVVPFADFESNENPGEPVDTSILDGLYFQVVGPADYDFCIRDFKWLDAESNEVRP